MNIIVIVTDTFRLDHFPGFTKSTVHAPNLERFASKSQVFENCRLGSFPTIPARADVITGKYSFTFMGWGPLPPNEVTLAETMTSAGYSTCCIADNPFMIRNGYGYDRGYDDFIWIRGQRAGAEGRDVHKSWNNEHDRFTARTFSSAVEWIERNHDEKFFLHLEPWDPHEPWDPPAYYVERYLKDYKGELVYPAYWDVEEAGVTERELEIASACYKAEVTMIDHWFGYLYNRLESLGILEDTAIIFTSDHGFYFGEHGIFGKRRFLWDKKHPMNQVRFGKNGYYYSCPLHQELTRIPFVFYHPKKQAKKHGCLLSLCDLTSTVMELGGAESVNSMHSRSVMPVVNGETSQHRDIVVSADADAQMMRDTSKAVDDVPRLILETCPATIFDGKWELIYSVENDPHYLYDAVNDPDHNTDLAKQYPDKVQELHQRYVTWLNEHNVAEHLIKPRLKL